MVVPLANTAGVEVTIEGPEDDGAGTCEDGDEIAVLADRVRLRQVLVNLLSNAVKYNREGGEVRVRWKVRGDRCAVSVADNGLGMTPDMLNRLFEPFD